MSLEYYITSDDLVGIHSFYYIKKSSTTVLDEPSN